MVTCRVHKQDFQHVQQSTSKASTVSMQKKKGGGGNKQLSKQRKLWAYPSIIYCVGVCAIFPTRQTHFQVALQKSFHKYTSLKYGL